MACIVKLPRIFLAVEVQTSQLTSVEQKDQEYIKNHAKKHFLLDTRDIQQVTICHRQCVRAGH